MAELFVINLDADLDGQYLSDLPVVNATPVARQIGFYLGTALTATSAQASSLATYLASAEFTDSTDAQVALGDVYVDDALSAANALGGGAAGMYSSQGTLLYAQGALDAADEVLLSEVVGKIIANFVVEYANGDHTNAITLANLEAEIDAVLIAGSATGTALVCENVSSGLAVTQKAAPAHDLDADGNVALTGILRILMGAEPSGAGTFAEGAIIGNHRLIGGTRRIYSRDRIDACIHEGSLSHFKSATAFDGSAKPAGKGVQCLILNESGAKQ